MRCWATVRSTGQRCSRPTDGDSITCSLHEHVGIRQTGLMDVLAAAVDTARAATPENVECPYCDGMGHEAQKPCPECDGTGRVTPENVEEPT